MTQKTVLNDAHRALGAKMVDFGGWDMPISYGSQIDEHHQVRRDAGMFDVSHMTVVDLRGEQTRPFLRKLVANSVDKLQKSGKALYTCMLDERGRRDRRPDRVLTSPRISSASSSTPPPARRTWRGSTPRPRRSASASPSAPNWR